MPPFPRLPGQPPAPEESTRAESGARTPGDTRDSEGSAPTADADDDLPGWGAAGDEAYAELDELQEEDEEEPLISTRGGGRGGSAQGNELFGRLEGILAAGLHGLADQLEEAANRLGPLAELRPRGSAPNPLHTTLGWMEGAADYLRTNDVQDIGDDLSDRVREKPVQTLGIALCVGFVLGRIVR